MVIKPTPIPDLLVIEPAIWRDERGLLIESFQEDRYKKCLQFDEPFVQDNLSISQYGVVRGLHFQKQKPQGKLITCIDGHIFDVVVDLRGDSDTFGETFSIHLDSETLAQLWVPPGFAHGFCALSPIARVSYKCTNFYDPEDEGGILWSDPDLAIEWPDVPQIVSEKDRQLQYFRELFG